MPRYLSEHQIDDAGTRLTLSKQVLFRRVFKVSNYFVLVAEVLNSESSDQMTIDIVIKHQNEYINPKARYIDSVTVGNGLFHFFAQPVDAEEDEEEVPEEDRVVQQDPSAPPPKEEDVIFEQPAAVQKKVRGW